METRGQLQLHAVKWFEQFVKRRPQTFLRYDFLPNRLAQDDPHFFFHGPAMARRPDAKSGFHLVIQIANCDAGHRTLLYALPPAFKAVLAMLSDGDPWLTSAHVNTREF